ncbi:nitrilase family protein [Flavobacteriaceae bacterium]|nr:nitrilase family protein [Flavobacteriaceae bacterium]
METKLNVALIQTDLVWEQPGENRKHIEFYLNKVSKRADVIFLPEMFTSGFTMNPKSVAESMSGTTITWMKNWSVKLGAAIAGSLVVEENGKFYNRFVWVNDDGSTHYYNKRHLFTLAGEDQVYEEGTDQSVFNFKGWNVCLRICYDLRFPVWSRNKNTYDLLVFVANWPAPRINAWDALLKARAIENMSYVIGVNRIGKDAKKNEYPGHSVVYDLLGHATISPGEEGGVLETILDKKVQDEVRTTLNFLEDQDSFLLQ